MEINNRISLVFQSFRDSQTVFANKIGASQSFLSAVMKGKNKPSIEMLEGIIEQYGIDADWLMTGRGEMHGRPTPAASGIQAAPDTPAAATETGTLDKRLEALARLLEKLPVSEQEALLHEWQRNADASQEFAEMKRKLEALEKKAG